MAERVLSGIEPERAAEDFERLEKEKMGAGTHERLHATLARFLEDVCAIK
jgi:hypothetical protein